MPSAYWRVIVIVGASLIFELPLFFYVMGSSRGITRVGLVAGIFIGLLLLSQVARYLGALLFAVSSGYTLWSAFASKAAIPPLLSTSILVSAILQLAAAYLLVFSKSFSSELKLREANASSYLRGIRMVFWILIGICAAYATANDIQHLAK